MGEKIRSQISHTHEKLSKVVNSDEIISRLISKLIMHQNNLSN